VLELGCGDAGNLAPMAEALPGAEFVGVDSSAAAIARGRELTQATGIANLTLECRAIEDYEGGEFDYVIAHGVYSWVAPPVRDRLLALCARAGVAYVSYNALPGGWARRALREMLMFHVDGLEDPQERLEQSRALLRFLLDGWPPEHELRRQAERLLERSDASMVHDELAPINDPVTFTRFAAHAAEHGLRYLAEADFFEMQTLPHAERLRDVDDDVRREQYLDFLKGRSFRQTLLCPVAQNVDRTLHPEVLQRLAVSCPAKRVGDAFEGPGGTVLRTDHPAVIAALERLADAWPGSVWASELGDVEDALLGGYAAGFLELHASPPHVASRPGERPEASPLARYQAAHGELVTNLRHRSVRLEDEPGRKLVTLLDGTRDRAALAAELPAKGLERSLEGLARLALLREPAPE
jgi:hypothetical protein